MKIKDPLDLPTKIEVLGIPFQVSVEEELESDDEECDGTTNGTLRIIRIKKEQGIRRQWTTLLHEYLHASLHVNGVSNFLDDEVEEVICQTLEHSLELFLRKHGTQILEALKK